MRELLELIAKSLVDSPDEVEVTEGEQPPKGIDVLDGNTWHVKKWRAERWKDNPYRLGDAEEQGIGWKLKSIRHGSPGWWIGLRNGDVIKKVNGLPLDTMPQLLFAYLKLKNDTEFEVKIQREGSTITHYYRIVEIGEDTE